MTLEGKIHTGKSGKVYRAVVGGTRLTFMITEDGAHVFIYTPQNCLGGYKIERFGGVLNPAGIRRFVQDNFN